MSPRFFLACVAISSIVACTDDESGTNLHKSGPPTIEQIRILEDPAGSSPQTVFGFGWFPDVTTDIDHPVTSASASEQKLRIIMGKLLQGNYLQQVLCSTPVRIDFDGTPTAYDMVPVGATPDDIAKCTQSTVVQQTCKGDLATCICQLDAGCGTGTSAVDKGVAVGIVDANNDGAADQMRFTPGAVEIHCTGNLTNMNIKVPTDLTNSYYNPSGFQQAPFSCPAPPCYDQLGPAIVLQPVAVGMPGTPAVPTSSTCGLTFSPDVVDKSNTQVCAAPNGRPPECDNENLDQCTLDQQCTPGDVTAFSFTTEPLSVSVVDFSDGDVGVSRTQQVTVQTHNKVPLDPGSIANLDIVDSNGVSPAYTVTMTQSNVIKITWTGPTGLAANTMYTITFRTTFADYYLQGLPAPIVVHFTTGA